MAGAASIKDYIGSKVSLISASDVRYEGCLYTIDPEESTVALQRVRCMGTEYRRTGDQAIPPSDTTYEFIIFRGEHIKSLHVAEDQRSPTRNENPDMLNLLKFSSPNKGDKRGGNRSNGVDAYPPDDRSPPKRFVGIAPQRPPPRQYDDFQRGPVYDGRRQRRSSPQHYQQQHYNQPHQDHGYQRYPPYAPPVERGYPPQGGYRGYNRGGRRPEQQWGGGYYPQQQQNYGGNWGRRQRRPRNQRRGNYRGDGYQDSYRNDYRENYRENYQENYRQNYRGQRGYQSQDRQKDKRDVVPGQGGFLQKVGQTKKDIDVPDAEFAISNEGFDKAKLKEEYAKRVEESKTGEPSSTAIDEKNEPEESTSAGHTEESPKKKYEMPEAAYKSKGGFFDSLSTDRDQKVDKEALKQQRRVDEDTFGEIAKNYMSRHNRRRGGGGGGGARRWGGAQRGRQRPRRSRTWFPRK